MKIQSDRSEIVDERVQTVTTASPIVGEEAAPAPAPVEVVSDTAVGSETALTSRTSRFTPAAAVAGIAAIALLLLGGITAARAGIDSSLDEPVVVVAGFTATALLGLIEIAFGLMLLIAALTRSRRAILFLGIAGGVMALVAAALLPTVRRSSVVRRTSDVT